MGIYTDLEGVKGGTLPSTGRESFSSVSGGVKKLRTERLISAAGDHGAVTVWRDDAGQYQWALLALPYPAARRG